MSINVAELSVTVPTAALAKEYSQLSPEDLASFYNLVGRINAVSGVPTCVHMHSVAMSSVLNAEGRQAMRLIGEYGFE